MAASGEARRVLVYGGRGALGSRCVQAFRARNWVMLRDIRCERRALGVEGAGAGIGDCRPCAPETRQHEFAPVYSGPQVPGLCPEGSVGCKYS